MSSFFKNKNFVKISILLGVSIVLFFCLFLNENLNIKSLEKKTTEASFFKKSLDNYNDFFEIQKITLNGRGKSDLSSIKNIVNSELYKNKNIIKYNTLNIRSSLEKLNWIDKVSIRKVFPNQIIVNIKEHKEFVILNEDKKNFLISDEGKIIYEIKDPNAYKLIHLEGEFAIKNINQIKSFFLNHHELKEHISKIIVSPNNRWDVIVRNILFKLPKQNIEQAVSQINRFYNLKNLEMVDLRFFEKKIFLKMNTKEIALKNKK
tara:strand:- start:101 stop:886 length:786 start_codon:yes stop_codon:yes gene_type:complete